jgi:2,3-bisphosphoglycerate-dependent phosphoglycerate mutase
VKETLVALIMRHGETGLNASNCYRSWSDPPLNENGIAQARAAAKFLERYDIETIITSPLLRAFVTGDIVSRGTFISQHRGLFPWRLGIFTGLPRDDHDEALRLFIENPDVAIPEGESLSAFEDRQFAFWDEALKQARKSGLTLYVAHTSNTVALLNFTENDKHIEPERGDAVKPGGIAAIYWNGSGHRVDVIFGQEEVALFGGS